MDVSNVVSGGGRQAIDYMSQSLTAQISDKEKELNLVYADNTLSTDEKNEKEDDLKARISQLNTQLQQREKQVENQQEQREKLQTKSAQEVTVGNVQTESQTNAQTQSVQKEQTDTKDESVTVTSGTGSITGKNADAVIAAKNAMQQMQIQGRVAGNISNEIRVAQQESDNTAVVREKIVQPQEDNELARARRVVESAQKTVTNSAEPNRTSMHAAATISQTSADTSTIFYQDFFGNSRVYQMEETSSAANSSANNSQAQLAAQRAEIFNQTDGVFAGVTIKI